MYHVANMNTHRAIGSTWLHNPMFSSQMHESTMNSENTSAVNKKQCRDMDQVGDTENHASLLEKEFLFHDDLDQNQDMLSLQENSNSTCFENETNTRKLPNSTVYVTPLFSRDLSQKSESLVRF